MKRIPTRRMLVIVISVIMGGVLFGGIIMFANFCQTQPGICSQLMTREEAGQAMFYIGRVPALKGQSESFIDLVREARKHGELQTGLSWRAKLAICDTNPIEATAVRLNRGIDAAWNRWHIDRDWVGRRFCFHNLDATSCCSSFADTCIFAITGKGTVFEDEGDYEPTEPSDNSIILIEARGTHLEWMRRGDVTLYDLDSLASSGMLGGFFGKYCSNYGDGFHVMFADGEVWYLRNDVPYQTFRKFCVVVEARELAREVQFHDYLIDRIGSVD